ncbi:M28 family peptidase [Robiginitomaculum antarcticum]|uniref:M28 family peptidase n=1 Tax=Robiginitomaculum antarcticum TaxID=437507 RepID=UPI00037E16B0|nr:M28 family peptidase [Robiginitomaculum antarcticum]
MNKQWNFGFGIAVLLLFIIFTARSLLTAPPAVDPDHAFQTERAFSRLSRILGDERSHPVDSEANDAVRGRLLGEITALGFTPIIRDDFHCVTSWGAMSCARVQNVMFWVTAPGDDAIVLASHYDSVAAGPGAADDGSGVAVSLEVASLIKPRNMQRPVLVLITDGEETGLIGAASFVKNDPLAKNVGAVISMEARGNTGRVSMFETGTPNGRDISVLSMKGTKPASSSLIANIYDIMPNGTDVTEYKALDIDVANYAMASDPEFYHTPGDNLANLSRGALFHMGANALAAVEAYDAQSHGQGDGQWMYTDVFGIFIIKLPQILALPFVIFGAILVLAAYARRREGRLITPLLVPPAALFSGVGLAIGLTALVALMRPELYYAAANAWAIRGVQNGAALLGAVLVLAVIAKNIDPLRLTLSGWLWLALLGGVSTVFIPGTAILFSLPLLIAGIGAVLALTGRLAIAKACLFIGALIFAAFSVMTTAVGEVMLFPEHAAPFTALLVLSFTLIAPLFWTPVKANRRAIWAWPVAGSALSAVFVIAAMIVPAYSAESPRGLSVMHIGSDQSGGAQYAVRTADPLPLSMLEKQDFIPAKLDGFNGDYMTAAAPDLDMSAPVIEIISDETLGDNRRMEMRITGAQSDVIDARIKGDSLTVNSLTINGFSREGNWAGFRCTGRSCRELAVTLDFNRAASVPSLTLTAYRYGLGEESRDLLAALPDWALPQHGGDMRVTRNIVALD